MITYKEALTVAMNDLAADPAARFIGYGVKQGRAMGTLKNVSDAQLIETPVAENLMVGIAIGLSLAGCKPVVFIERMDFILNAADAIVNHLDKIATMSRWQFAPAVILRVVVGNSKKPLFTGETHTQDFTFAFREMVNFPVMCARSVPDVRERYQNARRLQAKGVSSMIVEYKDLI